MNWRDKTILIIDDEPHMCELIAAVYRREGAHVLTAHNGESGLRRLYEHRPDLILLDILMPGMNGLEVVRSVRQLSDVPLIMLTAVNHSAKVVSSLQAGADDYVTKPFKPDELLARSWAVIRRAGPEQEAPPPLEAFDDDYLRVDFDARRVVVAGKRVRLTATEYDLLAFLVQNAGRVCTYQQILENVWGENYQGSAENVHVFIWQLRHKIEEDPKNPRYLLSVHSVGYRFELRPSYEPPPADDANGQ